MVTWLSETARRVYIAFREGGYLRDPHAAIRQVERGITDDKVEAAIGRDVPEIIENAAHYWKGPAILIRGEVGAQVLHIFCTIEEPILFVTCYEPDPKRWYPGFRERRRGP